MMARSVPKRSFGGVFATVLLVVLSLFVARPASAASGSGLTLAVTSGSAGTRVEMTGTGFLAGEQVQPYWDYVGPGTGIAAEQLLPLLAHRHCRVDGIGVG